MKLPPDSKHLRRIQIKNYPVKRTKPNLVMPHTSTWDPSLAPHRNVKSIHISYSVRVKSLSSTVSSPSQLTTQPTSKATGHIFISSKSANDQTTNSLIAVNNLYYTVHHTQADIFLTTACLHLSANHHLHPIIQPELPLTTAILTNPRQRTKYRIKHFQLISAATQQIALGAPLRQHSLIPVLI
jgi:hypothetical protein